MPAAPNVRQRAHQAASALQRHVLGRIASGQLLAGDRLPTERELALQFGGGRGTIRKALGELEAQGWIGREVGRGTFVKKTGEPRQGVPALGLQLPGAAVPSSSAPGLPDLAALSRLASPQDVMELRLMLEPLVIEQAVSRASAAEIDAMYECLEHARRSRTLEEFEHWDDQLHRSFAAASRNPLFVAIYAIVGAVRLESPWGELKRRTLTEALKKKHFQEHVQLVDAVRARDAQAARQRMHEHLDHIRRNMFGSA